MAGQPRIPSVNFSADAPGPHLLVTGGVHGDEFEPMAAIRRLIARFRADVSDARLKAGRLTLVPVVNEAAFLRGTRTAEDELDLGARVSGRSGRLGDQRTAHALSQLIRSADFYVDLHSGGTAFSVLPLTGYTLHSDARVLDRQRRMARAFNLPIVWGTCGTLEGRSLSVARDAGVPAIYAEYRGSGGCDPAGVAAYVDGCLNVMGLLEMIDRSEPESLLECTIEDPRPDSGYMQVCNPSPVAGFFEAAVTLGQRIESGTLLGTVTDAVATAVHEIRSEHAGIVLVLRTFSRVLAGESVGVVLEVPPTAE